MPRRRQFLRAGALLTAGLAGCLDGSSGTDSPGSPTETTAYRGTGYATTTAPYTERSPRPLAPSGAWLQYQADGANTGARDGPGVADGTPYWKRRVPGSSGTKGGVGTPVVAGEALFTGAFRDGDYRLVRLSAVDGVEAWSTVVPGWLQGIFAREDVVVVATNRGTVAFDRVDGTERWTGDGLTRPTMAEGVLYGGGGQGELRAITTTDGSTRWTVGLGGDLQGRPAVAGDLLVAATADPDELASFDPVTGAERWRAGLSSVARATPVVGPDGVAVLAADAARTFGHDGTDRWVADVPLGAGSGLALADGTLYVGGSDELVAIEASAGEPVWTYPTQGAGVPAVSSETVYLGTSLGSEAGPAVWAIGTDGEFAWNRVLPTFAHTDMVVGGVHTPPAVVNGAVYVNADDGLYAFVPRD